MALLHDNRSAWNKKTVLFVHGIGIQPAGYSEPLYQILRGQDPATADATRWHEIAYDAVNSAMEAKVKQLQQAIPASVSNPSTKSVVEDFLVDLVDYLCEVDPYNWINTVFRGALADVVAAGQKSDVNQIDHQIFIISHSLGTVVSYEALHSIVNDPQTLGLSSNFRVKTYFTLGCPLAFIKANQNRIPSLNDHFFLRTQPIQRPTRVNAFTGETQTNIVDWFNFQQKFDPVASLVPLTQANSGNALSQDTLVFDKFHSGVNPHAFDNYITEYKSFVMDNIGA